MRLRATVGWALPARQSVEAATIESTVQWTKKTTTKAWNAALRGSPDWGIDGSANVQTTRIALSPISAFASFWLVARNAFVNRKRKYGKRTSSAIATRPTARSGMFPG